MVLDNGSDTANAKRQIDSRFGDRVTTVLLSRTGIEDFYDPAAIVGWLRLAGILTDDLEEEVRGLLDKASSRVRTLEQLAKKHLNRSFNKEGDGLAIANLMQEQAIEPEIKELLLAIGAD